MNEKRRHHTREETLHYETSSSYLWDEKMSKYGICLLCMYYCRIQRVVVVVALVASWVGVMSNRRKRVADLVLGRDYIL